MSVSVLQVAVVVAVPMAVPEKTPALKKGFECRWEECEDFPNYDDPDRVTPEGFDDDEAEDENKMAMPMPRRLPCQSATNPNEANPTDR